MGRGVEVHSPASVPDAAPGGTSPDGDALAGRWLLALEALAARTAHEVNNALNGAMMNLEVVRLRARPGVDGGGAAPFAGTAGEELERAARYVGALLTLSRAPRGSGPADVAEELGHVAALLEPAFAQDRIALAVEPGGGRAPTAAPRHAVRLALVRAVLAAGGPAARGASTAEPGGAEPADESVRLLRCILRADPAPTLVVGPAAAVAGIPLPFDAADLAVLQDVGVGIHHAGGALHLQFPAP